MVDLGREGVLLSDPERGTVMVQAGAFRTKSKIENLQLVEKTAAAEKKKKSTLFRASYI